MSESSKKMRFPEVLSDDLVEHIMSTFLPIKSGLQSRGVSKRFRHAEIRSRYLDFSEIYSMRRSQLEVMLIIEDIFGKHKGSQINQLILTLNPIGVEDKILTWIKTCVDKNVQELGLDFSKSKKVIEIPIDFSAIETLTVLELKWCKFKIPDNSPKGLKLLRTLSLMKTKMTKEMIDAIFSNCFHLESLELIKCRMYGTLSINAQNHKKFKSLVVYSMPNLLNVILNAPTLECYKYDGYVIMVDFSKVDALKEAKLHYRWRYSYNPSALVIANMGAYTGVHVLATTNIFLEIYHPILTTKKRLFSNSNLDM
ncbi:hypothetical protein EUTSA_v10024091mg [Eutrema salsugineum]|uniref:At1g61320/AtMIF1 LRR domain-containing protein n=1 Tax=Eutrema salsugineum TaxID=72664 RepID=V4KQD4_EUTSA|nr:hypothetical protein EUTSA_v10024091mg [Eutrema salsugineum]